MQPSTISHERFILINEIYKYNFKMFLDFTSIILRLSGFVYTSDPPSKALFNL